MTSTEEKMVLNDDELMHVSDSDSDEDNNENKEV